MDNIKEPKRYDCSRGCSVERNENGELDCNYRQGCCKLEVYDWLQVPSAATFSTSRGLVTK